MCKTIESYNLSYKRVFLLKLLSYYCNILKSLCIKN